MPVRAHQLDTPGTRPGPEHLWSAMYQAQGELRTLVELYALPMTNWDTVEAEDLSPEEQAVADAWNAFRLAFHAVEDQMRAHAVLERAAEEHCDAIVRLSHELRVATGKVRVRDAMLNGNPLLDMKIAMQRSEPLL